METYIFITIIAFTIGYIIASYFATKRYNKTVDRFNKNAEEAKTSHLNSINANEEARERQRETLVAEYEKSLRDIKSELIKYKTPKCSCGRFKKKGKLKCAKCEEEILKKSEPNTNVGPGN